MTPSAPSTAGAPQAVKSRLADATVWRWAAPRLQGGTADSVGRAVEVAMAAAAAAGRPVSEPPVALPADDLAALEAPPLEARAYGMRVQGLGYGMMVQGLG